MRHLLRSNLRGFVSSILLLGLHSSVQLTLILQDVVPFGLLEPIVVHVRGGNRGCPGRESRPRLIVVQFQMLHVVVLLALIQNERAIVGHSIPFRGSIQRGQFRGLLTRLDDLLKGRFNTQAPGILLAKVEWCNESR